MTNGPGGTEASSDAAAADDAVGAGVTWGAGVPSDTHVVDDAVGVGVPGGAGGERAAAGGGAVQGARGLADADGTGGPSDSADPGGIVHLSAAPVTFESTTVSDPRFVALADAAVADIAVRYESDEPMIPLRADHMVEVILACVAGQPVGCASLAVPPDTVADPSAAPGTEGGPASSEVPDQMTLGEVKRLYVAPEARRRGVARTLMRELETRAVQRGLAAMVLETGTAQPEALALYESLGFHLIAYYGHYAEDPRSRCYAKHLR